jgi:hypothetical protein
MAKRTAELETKNVCAIASVSTVMVSTCDLQFHLMGSCELVAIQQGS